MTKKTALGMGLLVGFFGNLAMAADSQKEMNIQNVRDQIVRKGAGWKAKESWVTRLSRGEVQRMLGLNQLSIGSLDFESMHLNDIHSKSTSLDWRNKDGINWLGPVMNQGNCGSCVAFSTVATLEAQVSISNGAPWLHPTYSPQELFTCGGGSCGRGWDPDSAASFLQSRGVPDEACMPYVSGSTGDDTSCSEKCSDSRSRSYKISNYFSPTNYGGSVDDVKSALSHGPLVTTLSVYEDFLAYSNGVYKHVIGEVEGGHAVSIVGYDDSKRAWLIRNSWGIEWGENGFAWVSWDDDSGVGANTWSLDVTSTQKGISVISPADREYISGNYTFSVQSQGLADTSSTVHLKSDNGAETVVTCTSVPSSSTCSAQWDTTQLTEGRYEVFAESTSTQNMKSQVRQIYVLNSQPTMSLVLSPDSGVDLGSTLSGRVLFQVKATYSPVPIRHLEFHVFDVQGHLVQSRSNDSVVENMKMGWRTNTLPNGNYQIKVHGETTYQGKVYSVDSNGYTVNTEN